VDPAHPRPQRFRSEIIEPESGPDQDRVERRHRRSGYAILPAPPRAHQVDWNEGPEQKQRHHCRAAMRHQEIGDALLPDLVAGDILLPIRNEPAGPGEQQDRKGCVDRVSE